MKNLIKLTIVLLCTFSILNASGHHHHHKHHDPVSKSAIKEQAIKQLHLLVEHDSVAKSWAAAPVIKTEKKTFGKFTEWVVQFKNEKMEDKKKSNFYLFLNLNGKVLGGNYTGK